MNGSEGTRRIPLAVWTYLEEARALVGMRKEQVPLPRASFASGGCFDQLSRTGVVKEGIVPLWRASFASKL